MDVQGIDTAGAFVAELNRAFPDDSVKGYLRAVGAQVDRLLKRFKKADLRLPGGLGGGIELQALPDTPGLDPPKTSKEGSHLSPL